MFEMRSEWCRVITRTHSNAEVNLSVEESKVRAAARTQRLNPHVEQAPPGRCYISPTSNRKFIWDMMGLVLIAYDFITIPMQVFPLGESTFTLTMGYITTVFWTFDMFMSCIAGYYDEGIVISDHRRIIKH